MRGELTFYSRLGSIKEWSGKSDRSAGASEADHRLRFSLPTKLAIENHTVMRGTSSQQWYITNALSVCYIFGRAALRY